MIKKPLNFVLTISIILNIIIFSLFSCGGFKNYPAVPIEQVDFLSHAETKTENEITVTTSVLTNEESKRIFGVDLFEKGIQPVWIEIKNDTDYDFVFLPISVDPDYFAPNEVAFLFQGLFNGGKVHPQLSDRFNDYGYELSKIFPGETRKGFLYTNFDPGIKYINVNLFSEEKIETFVFYLLLRDASEEFYQINFDIIYSDEEFTNYENENDFIQAVKNLPCCTKNNESNEEVYPINFVFIGDDEDVFSALIRRGWDVTEPYSDVWRKLDVKKYFSSPLFRTSPMENLYYFDRTQDVSLQKSRRKEKGTIRQRNEMRIWLSPIKYKGESVWAGSTTRDIGTDVNKFRDFLTKKIDPDLNETRSYLFEDMALSQNVSKIGWIRFLEVTTKENPNINFDEQTWWSDGLVLVLLFDDIPTSISDISFFEWDYPYSSKSKVSIKPGPNEK
ncbi:MAG: LssY C-terminal domain-containing protein [Thermodesulfobacteriota bacterium]